MITDLQFLAAKIYFTFCSYCHMIPWEWSDCKGVRRITVTQNKWKKRCWIFNGCINALLVLVLTTSVFSKKEGSMGLLTIMYMLIPLTVASTVLYFVQVTHGYQELATIIQVCLNVDQHFKVHFKNATKPKMMTIDLPGLCMCLFVPGILFVGFCMGAYFALSKESALWDGVFNFQNEEMGGRIWIMVIRFWVTYYLLVVFMAPMAIYVMSAVILVQMSNFWTKVFLLQPDITPDLLRLYMEFKMQNTRVNVHMHWLSPMLVTMCMVVQVICNFATLRLRHSVRMPGYLVFPGVALVIMGAEILLFPIAAKMHGNSNQFLLQCRNHQTPFVHKFGVAYKPLFIGIGNYGFMDIPFLMTFFSMVVDSTIDALMSIEI